MIYTLYLIWDSSILHQYVYLFQNIYYLITIFNLKIKFFCIQTILL